MKTRRAFPSAGYVIAAIVTLGLSFTLFANSTKAETTKKKISVVAIGDSYTAGNGAGDYYGTQSNYRSRNSWSEHYVSWLNENNVSATLSNFASSGAKTTDITKNQVDKIPSNTNLVMLTAGGNDVHFEDIVKQCFVIGVRDAAGCKKRVDEATNALDATMTSTEEVLQALDKKLADSAKVVLVGYPLLSLDTEYILVNCRATKFGLCTRTDVYKPAAKVRELGKLATKKQTAMVEKWNKTHAMKVTYIPDVATSFSGHEPHPSVLKRNDVRWLNEFLETEGTLDATGKTAARYSGDQNEWYHPNKIGHQKIAEQIIETVGTPLSAPSITPQTSTVDIAFTVDTSGSMMGIIDTVKQDIMRVSQSLQHTSLLPRFSLVDFRDFPERSGTAEDYASKRHLPFTHSLADLQAAVNQLTIGYGGDDFDETAYSGIMESFRLDWRPGVRKILFLLTNTGPHDPEPYTGYTRQSIAKAAYDLDPVEIYVINTTSAMDMRETPFMQLTEQTGGHITELYGDYFAETITRIVSEAVQKPFGWIQGPYVAKIGDTITLDARGSYAVDSAITAIEWDLDGDGSFETPSDSLLLSHQFNQPFGDTVGIRITDANGRAGVGSTRLDVTDDGDTIPADTDNCPLVANLSQSDTDSDGVGDTCDSDSGWRTTDKPGVREFTSEHEMLAATVSAPAANTSSSSHQASTVRPPSSPLQSTSPTTPSAPLFITSASLPHTATPPLQHVTAPRSTDRASHRSSQKSNVLLNIATAVVVLLAAAGIIRHHIAARNRQP